MQSSAIASPPIAIPFGAGHSTTWTSIRQRPQRDTPGLTNRPISWPRPSAVSLASPRSPRSVMPSLPARANRGLRTSCPNSRRCTLVSAIGSYLRLAIGALVADQRALPLYVVRLAVPSPPSVCCSKRRLSGQGFAVASSRHRRGPACGQPGMIRRNSDRRHRSPRLHFGTLRQLLLRLPSSLLLRYLV